MEIFFAHMPQLVLLQQKQTGNTQEGNEQFISEMQCVKWQLV